MDIHIRLDDRVAAAAGGAIGIMGCAAAAAVLARRKARVQAAWWALLGRPVAYRLHLHGTGIELAPWDKNLVAECVIRDAPEYGIRIGPVEQRPDQGGSVIRDTTVMRSGGGISVLFSPEPGERTERPETLEGLMTLADLAAQFADIPGQPSDFGADEAEISSEEDATGYHLLTAVCQNGHEFESTKFARLGGRASITLRDTVLLRGAAACPECGSSATIPAGRYSLSGGIVIREAVPQDPGAA
jgi:hypothetical protein